MRVVNQVAESPLEFVEQFCYDYIQEFTHEGWRGRMRTCNGIHPTGIHHFILDKVGQVTEDMVKQFDQQVAEMLKTKYPEEPLKVWHRIWTVVVRNPM